MRHRGRYLVGVICLLLGGTSGARCQEMPTLNLDGTVKSADAGGELGGILGNTDRLEHDLAFDKLRQLLMTDVLAYYGLGEQYQTELKKAAFRDTQEYRDYKHKLTVLRKDALGRLYSLGLYPQVQDYDLKKGGFRIELGGGFNLSPLATAKVRFKPLPAASGRDPWLFLPASKQIGIEIEELKGQRGALGIYFVFPVIHATQESIIAPHVRVILVSMKTGEAIIDKSFYEGSRTPSPESKRARTILDKIARKDGNTGIAGQSKQGKQSSQFVIEAFEIEHADKTSEYCGQTWASGGTLTIKYDIRGGRFPLTLGSLFINGVPSGDWTWLGRYKVAKRDKWGGGVTKGLFSAQDLGIKKIGVNLARGGVEITSQSWPFGWPPEIAIPFDLRVEIRDASKPPKIATASKTITEPPLDLASKQVPAPGCMGYETLSVSGTE